MKRIGILTAGGDTPALNATIHGAMTRANQLRIEVVGLIHARRMHPALYDPQHFKPSTLGIEYLDSIFSGAIGDDVTEHVRRTLFSSGNLQQPYLSINTDVNKRIRYLADERPAGGA